MTEQVAINEMMNHLGTAIIVMTGSIIAFSLYPNIGVLFVVSPIACIGFLWFLNQIRPEDIDHDAARGLTAEVGGSKPPFSPKEYVPPASAKSLNNKPSFNFGDPSTEGTKAETPLQILRDPVLLIFILVCFLFHTANGTILPLVMQTLAIGNGRSGILLSGLCITVAQIVMVMAAKICGDYSRKYGRKMLFLIGLFIVPVRCLILGGLLQIRGDGEAGPFLQFLILSTQILDGVGAGTFGTMYILVTSDVSGGTGRFGLTLGLTTAAMSIGGTVSGYLGQALAQDLGYQRAFFILMVMSMVPALLYLFLMPETLPDNARKELVSTIDENGTEEESPEKSAQPKAGGSYTELV
jgi:hypothetical protein